MLTAFQAAPSNPFCCLFCVQAGQAVPDDVLTQLMVQAIADVVRIMGTSSTEAAGTEKGDKAPAKVGVQDRLSWQRSDSVCGPQVACRMPVPRQSY